MDDTKKQSGMVYNVIQSVVLAVAVGLTCWTASKAVALGEVVSSQATQIAVNTGKIDVLELHGSRSLESHVKDDDTRVQDIKDRVARLESAVIALQATPGELKAIGIRLETLRDGQARIEKMVDKPAGGTGK